MKGSDYAARPMMDRVEGSKNRLASQSMILMGLILDAMDTTDGFTLQNVCDTFNAVGKVGDRLEPEYRTVRIRFGESHLKFLVRKQLLEFDPETKIYRVNLESQFLSLDELDSEDEDIEEVSFADIYDKLNR